MSIVAYPFLWNDLFQKTPQRSTPVGICIPGFTYIQLIPYQKSDIILYHNSFRVFQAFNGNSHALHQISFPSFLFHQDKLYSFSNQFLVRFCACQECYLIGIIGGKYGFQSRSFGPLFCFYLILRLSINIMSESSQETFISRGT